MGPNYFALYIFKDSASLSPNMGALNTTRRHLTMNITLRVYNGQVVAARTKNSVSDYLYGTRANARQDNFTMLSIMLEDLGIVLRRGLLRSGWREVSRRLNVHQFSMPIISPVSPMPDHRECGRVRTSSSGREVGFRFEMQGMRVRTGTQSTNCTLGRKITLFKRDHRLLDRGSLWPSLKRGSEIRREYRISAILCAKTQKVVFTGHEADLLILFLIGQNHAMHKQIANSRIANANDPTPIPILRSPYLFWSSCRAVKIRAEEIRNWREPGAPRPFPSPAAGRTSMKSTRFYVHLRRVIYILARFATNIVLPPWSDKHGVISPHLRTNGVRRPRITRQLFSNDPGWICRGRPSNIAL